MSIFTVAIIVYAVLMVILEIIQGGRRKRSPTLKEEEIEFPKKEKIPPEEEVHEKGKNLIEKEVEEFTPVEFEVKEEERKGVTLEYTKEKLEETGEGVSLEYKGEEVGKKEKGVKEVKERALSLKKLVFLKENELLKLVIYKEILEPHHFVRRFLFKRRI